MHKTRITKLNYFLNNAEFKRISEIIKQNYDLNAITIEKVRSVYKIMTSSKSYCLKEFKHNDKKAIIGFYLTKYLKENGFDGIADYYLTTDKKEYIKGRKRYYYLTSWINGRECNLDNYNELEMATELLADFHNKSKGFKLEKIKILNNFNKWQKKLLKIIDDLNMFKKIITQKRVKTTFDISYLENIDYYLDLSNKALNIFKSEKYKRLCERAKVDKSICHDSFYYQNLLIDKNNKLYLIDLDSVIYDLEVYDLAKFIRRILNKKTYSWDFNVAKELIRIYSAKRAIERDEYEIMLGFFMIPHRFWKIGRKRYIKHKEWSEDKYYRKLEKEIRLRDKREKFLIQFREEYLEI